MSLRKEAPSGIYPWSGSMPEEAGHSVTWSAPAALTGAPRDAAHPELDAKLALPTPRNRHGPHRGLAAQSLQLAANASKVCLTSVILGLVYLCG